MSDKRAVALIGVGLLLALAGVLVPGQWWVRVGLGWVGVIAAGIGLGTLLQDETNWDPDAELAALLKDHQ